MSDGIKMVCYTDGSSQPNPGFGGYGVYGYTYKESKNSRNITYPVKTGFKYTSEGIFNVKEMSKELEKEKIEVISIIEHIGSANSDATTNNRCEINGLLTALKFACFTEGVDEILVISDSKYALDGYTKGVPHWSKNFWKTKSGTDVKNKDLWIMAQEIRETLKEKNIKVRTKWVKGHEADEGNIVADIYALIGTNFARNQFSEGEFYQDNCLSKVTLMSDFKRELMDRPMIYSYNSALFNTGEGDSDRLMAITTVNPFVEQDMGKRDVFGTYSLFVGDIPTHFRNLKTKFNKYERHFNVNAIINLDTLKKDKMLSRIINLVGLDPIIVRVRDGYYNKLMAFNRDGVIVEELTPAYTHMKEVYETFDSLNHVLVNLNKFIEDGTAWNATELFINNDDPKKQGLYLRYQDRYFDLTDTINVKGLKFVTKPNIVIGMDTPPFAVFKDLVGTIKDVFIIPDTTNNPDLATLVTVIVYEKDGEEHYVASTNLLNKFLVQHD